MVKIIMLVLNFEHVPTSRRAAFLGDPNFFLNIIVAPEIRIVSEIKTNITISKGAINKALNEIL